jgi:hypothetical protein
LNKNIQFHLQVRKLTSWNISDKIETKHLMIRWSGKQAIKLAAGTGVGTGWRWRWRWGSIGKREWKMINGNLAGLGRGWTKLPVPTFVLLDSRRNKGMGRRGGGRVLKNSFLPNFEGKLCKKIECS